LSTNIAYALCAEKSHKRYQAIRFGELLTNIQFRAFKETSGGRAGYRFASKEACAAFGRLIVKIFPIVGLAPDGSFHMSVNAAATAMHTISAVRTNL
jgi:hypothetical protein